GAAPGSGAGRRTPPLLPDHRAGPPGGDGGGPAVVATGARGPEPPGVRRSRDRAGGCRMMRPPGRRRAPRLSRHAGLYRRLLVLYPGRFRHEYGPDMVQAFQDRLRDESATDRPGRVAFFWLWAVGDLV